MTIKYVLFAALTMVMSNHTLGAQGDRNQEGFNLCKKEIQRQYRKDRVLLHGPFYVEVSKEKKQRTLYINGGHWDGATWAHDRLTCLTSLNGHKLLTLERAKGRFVWRRDEPVKPEQEVAAKH